MKAVESHDWLWEIEAHDAIASEGGDCCDPGIGFVPGDGRILHICPGREDFYFHYHFSEPTRFLGLFKSSRQMTWSALGWSADRKSEVVRKFYEADHDWFAENTTSA